MKINNKAFTLVELLVVVLIIGILAAIAVPQYQVAVRKSEFSTLKTKTKALAQAVNIYTLANGKKPLTIDSLDISLPNISSSTTANEGDYAFYVFFKNDEYCQITLQQPLIYCGIKRTTDYAMEFSFNYNTSAPLTCLANETDKIGNTVCQQETGKNKVGYTQYGTNYYYY